MQHACRSFYHMLVIKHQTSLHQYPATRVMMLMLINVLFPLKM